MGNGMGNGNMGMNGMNFQMNNGANGNGMDMMMMNGMENGQGMQSMQQGMQMQQQQQQNGLMMMNTNGMMNGAVDSPTNPGSPNMMSGVPLSGTQGVENTVGEGGSQVSGAPNSTEPVEVEMENAKQDEGESAEKAQNPEQ